MERRPRKEETVIPMSNIAQVAGLLTPMAALALEGSIEAQSQCYQDNVRRQGLRDAPSQFAAFVIPLDSHLALPPGHTSIIHLPQEQSATMTLTHHGALEAKMGRRGVTAVMSNLVVGIGDKDTAKPLADYDEVSIMGLYTRAIRVANHTIMAYKLTPGRHNHDLRPVTVTDRPSFVDMFRFDTKKGEIIEAGAVHMHQNLLASVEHANQMSRRESASFAEYFRALGVESDDPAMHILATIYQAIDEVCIGHYPQGLVLADTYAEHSMRFSLMQLYMKQGLDEAAAERKVRSQGNLDKLVGAIATELHVPRPHLKDHIAFDAWRDNCRQKRNHITHNFTKLPVEPHEARTALHQTIDMIAKLSRFTMRMHADLGPQLRLFTAPEWYSRSIEAYDANDKQSLSRVTDIVTWQYMRP